MHLLHVQHVNTPLPQPKFWLSPELAAYVDHVALWDIFPDHRVVIADLSFQKLKFLSFNGAVLAVFLGKKLMWICGILPLTWVLFFSQTRCMRVASDWLVFRMGTFHTTTWSVLFERRVSQCITDAAGRVDRSFHGRGSI